MTIPTKILNSTTLFNIVQKKSWTPNLHIRMISEGSCDTEDWNNGCWKFSFAITGINGISKYIKIEKKTIFLTVFLLHITCTYYSNSISYA